MKLQDKLVIVTGAGSGIGRELTLQLLQKGARVAGVDIHADALTQTGQLAGVGSDRFRGFTLDIADKSGVDAFPETVAAHFGHPADGLINNAGIIQPFKPVTELTTDEINRVFNVNFYGTLYLTRAFLPSFLQRPEAHIVNISSMGGFLPVPGQTIYGAAKAAVKLFTEGLYAELIGTNVRVTVVFPGAIATNITENSGLGTPKASTESSSIKPMPADKAAGAILDAIETNRFRVTVGSDARFLDLLYRFNPRYATEFIEKKMRQFRKM
ncbi:SDR family NAD(P)-dependent oxidoreductase [Rudanella paleaurantiibacter]|uniref:SDR family NAD(P)-dependent oxidoreductase n=1 Tax=Rudanella paleaurantiibacter TaxID=2614655 RepID=A0A7J5TZ45_9BACT|nr:SDR family NAD(P)-dependent oxidoreductase [Rudanella paleaurantiibacter]KAB7730418.1 SDR family NAD(P)-dependent oxidoreductase [Rudanella paleaurantiibacter]